MIRYQQGNCPGCGRLVAAKVGHPPPKCHDCATAYEEDDTVTQVLCLRNDELQAKVDALAAHVERLRAAALDVISFVPGGEVKARLRDAYDETPTTSLARQKLLWQAEAVETAVARGYRSRDELAGWAEYLRRQAEEGGSGQA